MATDLDAPLAAENCSTRRFDTMTDEGTPDAPSDDEESIGKGLKLQLIVVGGIVFLVLAAVFLGAL